MFKKKSCFDILADRVINKSTTCDNDGFFHFVAGGIPFKVGEDALRETAENHIFSPVKALAKILLLEYNLAAKRTKNRKIVPIECRRNNMPYLSISSS